MTTSSPAAYQPSPSIRQPTDAFHRPSVPPDARPRSEQLNCPTKRCSRPTGFLGSLPSAGSVPTPCGPMPPPSRAGSPPLPRPRPILNPRFLAARPSPPRLSLRRSPRHFRLHESLTLPEPPSRFDAGPARKPRLDEEAQARARSGASASPASGGSARMALRTWACAAVYPGHRDEHGLHAVGMLAEVPQPAPLAPAVVAAPREEAERGPPGGSGGGRQWKDARIQGRAQRGPFRETGATAAAGGARWRRLRRGVSGGSGPWGRRAPRGSWPGGGRRDRAAR